MSKIDKISKSEEEWREQLSEEAYKVTREKGTERPFSGKYNLHFEEGTYYCACCNEPLFASDGKFESGCGWPSFDRPINKDVIEYLEDHSLGMKRVEIVCKKCDSHLGHVFNDGPTDTGLRYCVNSVSLDFEETEGEQSSS